MTDNSTLVQTKPKKFKIKKKQECNEIKKEIDLYLKTILSSSDNIKYKRVSLSPL